MDPTDLGPGTVTWLGGTGTVLLGAFLWLCKWLSRDAADRVMDTADIGVAAGDARSHRRHRTLGKQKKDPPGRRARRA